MSPATLRPRADSVQPLRSDELTRTFAGEMVAEIHVSPKVVVRAESDIARHFIVSIQSAHEMIRTLENRGFISRGIDLFTGQAASRSLRVPAER